MLDDLLDEFIGRGWYKTDSTLIYPQTLISDEAGAIFNYLIVSEDESFGIHNPLYIVALLTNTLESLAK